MEEQLYMSGFWVGALVGSLVVGSSGLLLSIGFYNLGLLRGSRAGRIEMNKFTVRARQAHERTYGE